MNLVASSVLLSLLEVVTANEPRVVGGSDVKSSNKYPYQVSLQRAAGHFCGGSILNNRWILTAGHCLHFIPPNDRKKIEVMVGSVDRRYGEKYGIDYAIYHQKFVDVTAENDVGMVRVNRTIEFDTNVQPIALPTKDFRDFDSPVVFTGWGLLSVEATVPPIILQEIELKVIPYDICRPLIDANPGPHPVMGTNICTLTPKKGEGVCRGDSGGPLVANGVQIGIASFVIPCARGLPDVFTKVYAYVDWIEEEQMDYQLTNANNRHEPHFVIYFCALYLFHFDIILNL